MLRLFGSALSDRQIEQLCAEIALLGRADEADRAWTLVQPLVKAQKRQLKVAEALVGLVLQGCFTAERGREALTAVCQSHANSARVLGRVGGALESIYDRSYLNAAPPDDALLHTVATRLRELAAQHIDQPDEYVVQLGLATSARLLGRAWDETAERAHRRLLELRPQSWEKHYDFGLFLKTRGSFAEGMSVNQRAADLGGAQDESVRWNLGICATGAGDLEVALQVWRALGNTLAPGRFGLPEGGYASVKVRLAERPLAERTADADDPGQEETIWIERLSPCHGIVRSVLYYGLGVDFGDVVLFDGAPITHHTVGERDVPVFPHLATLVHAGYQFFHFAGTQDAPTQLADLSEHLPGDSVVYVHTEQVISMCQACWESATTNHEHVPAERRIVVGQIAAPPAVPPSTLLQALDDHRPATDSVRLFAPALCAAAGKSARAEVEQRRYDMLVESLT